MLLQQLQIKKAHFSEISVIFYNLNFWLKVCLSWDKVFSLSCILTFSSKSNWKQKYKIENWIRIFYTSWRWLWIFGKKVKYLSYGPCLQIFATRELGVVEIWGVFLLMMNSRTSTYTTAVLFILIPIGEKNSKKKCLQIWIWQTRGLF